MAHLALTIFLSVLAFGAIAAEITSDLALVCRSMAEHERIGRMIGARDQAAANALIAEYFRSGQCGTFDAGEKVRVEQGGFFHSCVARLGSTKPCVWVETRHVDVSR